MNHQEYGELHRTFIKVGGQLSIDTRRIVLTNEIHHQPYGLLATQAIHRQLQCAPFEKLEEPSPPAPSDSWRSLVHHHLSLACTGLK